MVFWLAWPRFKNDIFLPSIFLPQQIRQTCTEKDIILKDKCSLITVTTIAYQLDLSVANLTLLKLYAANAFKPEYSNNNAFYDATKHSSLN